MKKAADRQAKEEEKARRAAERAAKSVGGKKVGRGGRRGRGGQDRDQGTISETDSHDHHNEEQDQNWMESVENCPTNVAVQLEGSESELSQNATDGNENMEDVPRKQVTLRSGRVATLPMRYR
jgi:hypothetical protein